ncbi:ATP-dependent DNA helicase [Desulforhopalus sp. 52FAK]
MFQLDDIFVKNGVLADVLPGFEPREGQKEMAFAIETALGARCVDRLEGSGCLVVEAETGIGKTLAYLIPAALSGKKIVISTATLNLQDQIVYKDIPLVKDIVGEDLPVVCVKGRENYLCSYRYYQFCSNPQLSVGAADDIKRIDKWLKKTYSGDKAELEWLGERGELWSKISAKSSQCLGSNCPEGSECFVTRLRKKAGSARLLIVNHHLFFSDLALKKQGYGEILPRYEAVIFDEAHHIEDISSLFFSCSFSHYQLIDLLSDIEQQAKNDLTAEKIDTLLPMLSGLRKRGEIFAALFPKETGRYYLNSFIDKITPEVWLEEVELLNTGFAHLEKEMTILTPYGESWLSFAGRSNGLGERLRDIAISSKDEKGEMIRWYEKRERSVALSATPLEVSDLLGEHLYNSVDCCIMTSATLSTGGSFSYIKKRLGLKEETTYLQFASPFNYAQHSMIYIPGREFPAPVDQDYPEELNKRVCELLKLSSGRGLVLCTSFKALERLADYLEEKLDYKILVQGRGAKTALLDTFRKETNSVLIAVASFWEGVDVSGESLSCVIIDKLPFEVPTDPVLQTRIEKLRSDGGNPFFEYQVPRAVLALKQGVGRLIRSVTDTGVVAIMDVRLYTKGYGKTFLKSLPQAPVSREIEGVRQFFSRYK